MLDFPFANYFSILGLLHCLSEDTHKLEEQYLIIRLVWTLNCPILGNTASHFFAFPSPLFPDPGHPFSAYLYWTVPLCWRCLPKCCRWLAVIGSCRLACPRNAPKYVAPWNWHHLSRLLLIAFQTASLNWQEPKQEEASKFPLQLPYMIYLQSYDQMFKCTFIPIYYIHIPICQALTSQFEHPIRQTQHSNISKGTHAHTPF